MKLKQVLTTAFVTLSFIGTAFAQDAAKKEAPKKEEAKKEEPKKEEGKKDEGGAIKAQVAYPKGYRDWHHIKSMVIASEKHPLFAAFGGMHHVYANQKAVEALKAKKEFPTGAVFVLDLLDTSEQGGAFSAGKRKFIGVMHRDAKKYSETAGWGWEVFEGGDPNQRAVKTVAAAKACSTCHTAVGAKGFVFSEWQE